MISKNITHKDVLNAISEIDKNGIPSVRNSKKYYLCYKRKYYPPKYVLSIANKYANNKELEPGEFSGGDETNSFLIKLGFGVRECHDVILNKYKKKRIRENNIVTAIIESNGSYDNKSRYLLLEAILKEIENKANLIILPAGFINYAKISDNDIKTLESHVVDLLKKYQEKIVVCFGIDVAKGKHQLGIAISPKGILALGRKFFPTKREKNYIQKADSVYEKEFGFKRIFKWNGRNYFIAVCYDVFGIKHLKSPLQNIDYVIDLIHGFYPKGEASSGEVYFAKHGLAGASKEWKCPTFGSAVFFNRIVPYNWQSGIIWNKGKKSTQLWKYEDNPLKPINSQNVVTKNEKVIMRYFVVN